MRVLATISTTEKLRLAETLGADHAIDYVRQDFPKVVVETTGGRLVDVVFD